MMTGIDALSVLQAFGTALSQARPGVAMAVVTADSQIFDFQSGAEELSEDSLFEIGSITKTFTVFVLASAILRNDLRLDTRLGDVIGQQAGRAASVTLACLANHTSGLPRMAPNHSSVSKGTPTNPYSEYHAQHLLVALSDCELERAAYRYSNFGYQVLGYALESALGEPLEDLFRSLVFTPLGMDGARVSPPLSVHAPRPTNSSGFAVPHWEMSLPGPGGIICTVKDFARYTQAFINPPAALSDEIRLIVGDHPAGPTSALGWQSEGAVLWHGGATAGSTSIACVDRQSGIGLLALSNRGGHGALQRSAVEAVVGRSGGAGRSLDLG